MLFQEVIKIGPVFSCQFCSPADIAFCEFEEIDDVPFFKGIPCLFKK